MKSCSATLLSKDYDLSAAILPEVYLRCSAITELDFPWSSWRFERQTTEIRLAWTPRYFYVHLWAKDHFMTAQTTKPKTEFRNDDYLGIVLQGPSGVPRVWEINVLNAVRDYQRLEDHSIDLKWKSHALWKVRKHDAGWVAEAKIPFDKDFGIVPSVGDQWQCAFFRSDWDRRQQCSLSTWAEINPESPEQWAQATLGSLTFR